MRIYQARVAALEQDGIVVLENIIVASHIEMLRDRMLADVAAILKRDDVPFNFNKGNIQQDPPPFPPYIFRDVLVNDLVIQVTRARFGTGG